MPRQRDRAQSATQHVRKQLGASDPDLAGGLPALDECGEDAPRAHYLRRQAPHEPRLVLAKINERRIKQQLREFRQCAE